VGDGDGGEKSGGGAGSEPSGTRTIFLQSEERGKDKRYFLLSREMTRSDRKGKRTTRRHPLLPEGGLDEKKPTLHQGEKRKEEGKASGLIGSLHKKEK